MRVENAYRKQILEYVVVKSTIHSECEVRDMILFFGLGLDEYFLFSPDDEDEDTFSKKKSFTIRSSHSC